MAPRRSPDAPLPTTLAAIDLGSNSFHMIVARQSAGELKAVERLGEKVRLAAEMQDGRLHPDAIARGLDCLARFAQKLRGLEPQAVRVVGTNALRVAKNRRDFLGPAEELLGYPIDIVAGREEARLVYLGVAHSLPDDGQPRLVMDIGGGSTEFIVGRGFEPLLTESLHMGGIAYSDLYFPGGEISEVAFARAYNTARLEILNIYDALARQGWKQAIGSSGTLQAVEEMCIENGFAREGISREGIEQFKRQVLRCRHVRELDFKGLKPDRRAVLPAGLAIIAAMFDTLKLDVMHVAQGALREGALYDLLGRLEHEDVRERTVAALMQRYEVDARDAARVEGIASALLEQVAASWGLDDDDAARLLNWGARLHAVGLVISHSQFHKHGAYLLRHSDLPGFSRGDQAAVAALVRSHRRKLDSDDFNAWPAVEAQRLQRLCLLLRMAVLLKHTQMVDDLPEVVLQVKEHRVTLRFPEGWLAEHPLTAQEFAQEEAYLKAVGYKLQIR